MPSSHPTQENATVSVTTEVEMSDVVVTTQVPDFDSQATAKRCLSSLMDAAASSTNSALPPRPAGNVSLPTTVSKTRARKPLTTVGRKEEPKNP